MALTTRVLAGLGEVAPAAWNALVGDGSPFVEWEFLATVEDSGAATRRTGWLPQHLTVWDDARLVGACPLYVKGHSMGEFVFDQGWATAARRAGIAYYPKLLVAVPFSPVTGVRFLAAADHRPRIIALLAAQLEALCREHGFSSAHVNFCLPDEVEALGARGWLRRTGYQYQWTNPGFTSFDDYLDSLRSKRRNQVRREQREVAAAGIEIATYTGDEIPAALFPVMFDLYRTTIARLPWGQQYLDARFFALAAERFRQRVCCIVASQGDEIVAGTFNVRKGDVFYGRYWGAHRDVRHLHFAVCYYAAIAYCIAHRLRRFEPGAGGEFKHLRGFEATPTESMHFLTDERFAAAVADFLARERRAVAAEIDWLDDRSALRRE